MCEVEEGEEGRVEGQWGNRDGCRGVHWRRDTGQSEEEEEKDWEKEGKQSEVEGWEKGEEGQEGYDGCPANLIL